MMSGVTGISGVGLQHGFRVNRLTLARIRVFIAPEVSVSFKESGFYRLLGNRIDFGEVQWCLGLAVIFRSETAIARSPLSSRAVRCRRTTRSHLRAKPSPILCRTV